MKSTSTLVLIMISILLLIPFQTSCIPTGQEEVIIPPECWEKIYCPGVLEGKSTPNEELVSLVSIPYPWVAQIETFPAAFIFLQNEDVRNIGDIQVIREGDKQFPSSIKGVDESGNEVRIDLSYHEAPDGTLVGEAEFIYRGELEATIVEEIGEDDLRVTINYHPEPMLNVELLITYPSNNGDNEFPVQIKLLNQSFDGTVTMGDPDIPTMVEDYNKFLETEGKGIILDLGGPGRIAALNYDLLNRVVCCTPPPPEEKGLLHWCFTRSFVEMCGGCELIDWVNCTGQADSRGTASVLATGLADTFGPAASVGVGMLNAYLIDQGNE